MFALLSFIIDDVILGFYSYSNFCFFLMVANHGVDVTSGDSTHC